MSRWRAAIQQVITAGGPTIILQPIIDFAEGRIGGYEALARFGDEAADAPDRWVSRAHQVGMGDQLEASALVAALARREALEPHQFLTVNLSPSALASTLVQDALRRAAPLHGVIVELTEHDQIPDRPEIADAFLLVRDHGGMIAIDDIGTGYAGLERVLAVRPELVKLDAAFVRDIDRDEARATFVRAVGDLLDGLDTWLVAEGIETEGELEALVSLGVPLGQGFLLGRPAAAPAALAPHLRDLVVRARAAFAAPTDTVGRHLEHAPSFQAPITPAPRPLRARRPGRAAPRRLRAGAAEPADRRRHAGAGRRPGRVGGHARAGPARGRALDAAGGHRRRGPLPGHRAHGAPGALPRRRKGSPMKQFRCADVIPGCGRVFDGPDEDDILAQVADHAAAEHGMDEVATDVLDAVRDRITDR